MHVLMEYVQPLIDWLQANPNWGLLLTMLVSFTESLAIIGSIIPGSLTMTAIGILAGSGVLRIDLTIIAASIGALAGDSASYSLGYIFSDRLMQTWPFSHYPNLLHYGKEFFNKHGGKSVLIGRFIGPLRSIIPVIAGMMCMPRLHFFIANFLSAIGWSLLYILPGYWIGTAGSHLSTEGAQRLFGFIIILLLCVWIIGSGTRYCLKIINRWYNKHVHVIYRWSTNHPYWRQFFKELNQHRTHMLISLMLLGLTCLIMAIVLTLLVHFSPPMIQLNSLISFFLQSLRTPLFDGFLVMINFIISPSSIGVLFVFIVGIAIYARDWRILGYLLSLGILTVTVTWILNLTILMPDRINAFKLTQGASFPDIHLTSATALFSFIICYLGIFYRNELITLIRTIVIAILILAGFSIIYLGDNWSICVLSAYLIGMTLGLIHWIFYQRQPSIHTHTGFMIIAGFALLMSMTLLNAILSFQQTVIIHAPKHHQYVLNEDDWWYQDEPLLPLYTKNRIGQNTGLFNIQYAGSLQYLEKQLRHNGWVKQSGSLFSFMLIVGGHHDARALPLMQQLYLNKKPVLIMTYKANNNYYLIRLWRSNYHLAHYPEPIWLGSIILVQKKTNSPSRNQNNKSTTMFTPLLPAITNYRVTNINRKDDRVISLRYIIPPEILIIKESM